MSRRTNRAKAVTKSNRDTRIAETGMINLGKYIFLMIDELLTILLAAFARPVEKTFQIKRPDKTKIGYGRPCAGMFNVGAKNKVKITIIRSG